MKRLLVIIPIAILSLFVNAQTIVNVSTGGGFSASLVANGIVADTVTNLKITGNIDSRDIYFIRDGMYRLAILDLESVQIQPYDVFPANEIPANSFYNPSNDQGKDNLTTIKLPNSLISIGDHAFARCILTGNLSIPNSVVSIGRCAFTWCVRLTGSINISDAVTSIGDGAFSGCWNITSINVNESNSNFAVIDGVLFNKEKTKLIQFPTGKVAYSYKIPISVTLIGDYAFLLCWNLTGDLIIPNSVISIGEYAFARCREMKGILSIPNSVITIGKGAFTECLGFTGNLTIPNSVTSIGDYAFYLCSSLTGNLSISNSVITIGDYAFSGCQGFTGSLNIPNSVISIGNYAFHGCNRFTGNLTIPNSVTSIGQLAFAYCSGFTGNISISNSVASIGVGAFSACAKISSINVDEGNIIFLSIDGIMFNKPKTKLIQCPSGKIADSYKIPNSVDSIEMYAFMNCNGLTGNLTIPNSVTSIGGWAYTGCKGFTGSLRIPNSVISIGERAFTECIGISGNLIIPNSVTTINPYTFYGCSGLTSLTIPSSITSIGDYAFAYCTKMQKIISARLLPLPINQSTLLEINKSSCRLIVPLESKDPYQRANIWKDFYIAYENIFVYYDSKGGNAIADTIVNLNSSIIEPKDPIKKDYSFKGWYKEPDYLNAWNFNTDIVVTNTTLYAKWISSTIDINNPGKTNLSLYPNPAVGFVRIKGEMLKTITIYNLSGIVQLKLNIKGEGSADINVTHLISGFYLVHVKTINGNESLLKLVKE